MAGQKSAGLNLLLHSKIENESSDYNYYYYGSSERNRAMALETMLLLGQKQKAFAMASKLAKEMSNNQWMSTQTTAYCLYAMSKFAANNGPKGIDISFSKDGKSQAINTQKTIADRSLSVKTGANSITLKNNKKNTIYVRILNTGILPIGQEKAIQSNVSARLFSKTGKVVFLTSQKLIREQNLSLRLRLKIRKMNM